MKQGCRKKTKNNRGITLIALAVTILVLIILASISIKALTGDNGIIGQSKNAKDSAEIDSEKEVIETSVVQATGKDRYGNITKENMKEYMDKNAGEGKTEVIDNGDTLVVKFIESNRYYEIDVDGNAEGPKELIKDEYAGDLSKGGKNDGSEEKPFEINCIEDLVAFSQSVNSGNTYTGMYVRLMRTLNFNSIFSYNDYLTTEYDEYLGGDGTNELRKQLSQSGNGFVPIGNSADVNFGGFQGYFEGCNYEIQNIYINQESYSGLFGYISGARSIQNLGISGKIIATNGMAGGLIGYYNIANTGIETLVKNCYNEADIYSYGGTRVYWSSEGVAGGIIGNINGNINIDCCYNRGTITGEMSAGGIIGRNRCVLYC